MYRRNVTKEMTILDPADHLHTAENIAVMLPCAKKRRCLRGSHLTLSGLRRARAQAMECRTQARP